MTKFLVRYAKFAGTSAFGSVVDTLVLWLSIIRSHTSMYGKTGPENDPMLLQEGSSSYMEHYVLLRNNQLCD